MTIQTASGATWHVSIAQPATIDEAGFYALTYTQISEIQDLGERGGAFNTVAYSNMSDRRVRELKGDFVPSKPTIMLGKLSGDAGQLILQNAASVGHATTDLDLSFKEVLKDGTINYYGALVNSYSPNLGGSENIITAAVSISINTDEIASTTAYTGP